MSNDCGCFWLEPVATVLFMFCNAVSVECFLLITVCIHVWNGFFLYFYVKDPMCIHVWNVVCDVCSSLVFWFFSGVLAMRRKVRWVCMKCLGCCFVLGWV